MKVYVMATSFIKQEIDQAIELNKKGYSVKEIALKVGKSIYSVYRWKKLGLLDKDKEEYQSPILDDPELSIDDLLDKSEERFKRIQKAKQSQKWMEFKMKNPGPFGLVFVGDPHIGDQGCNIKLLREHISIIKETPSLYGVGLGDYTNNWSSKLAQRIAPLEETTRPQTWRLVDWFFREIEWFLLIKGNHEVWNGSDDVLDWMYRGTIPIQEWQAQFRITSPNKKEFNIWVAHDFPGHSQWNPLHGPMKKGKFSGQADVYVAGHKHNWALFHVEDADNKKTYWSARARGYKFYDHYATVLGIQEQEHGASVCAIFDPNKDGPAAVQMFADVEEASQYLTWKRKKYD